MKAYKTSTTAFTGTKYHDVYKKALGLYKKIKAPNSLQFQRKIQIIKTRFYIASEE